MPLPVTKGELNRLGDRLIATETPTDADLEDLKVVLAAYQDVLEQAKGDLHGLGFAPTGRVKTTKTMTDKLRRTHGMQLSRVQDLAGARIVVPDIAAQDETRDKISEFYAARGCPCRPVDRRADPRFGYRAFHLIVVIDAMPVEIQIRTELQDTWANIFERLADRWGRGIRYGQDPENPEVVVRSGELVTSRRGAIEIVMSLSENISHVEQARAQMKELQRKMDQASGLIVEGVEAARAVERMADPLPARMLPIRDGFAAILEDHRDVLDPEGQALLAARVGTTGTQLMRLLEISFGLFVHDMNVLADGLRGYEQTLRDRLQLVAGATDEGA